MVLASNLGFPRIGPKRELKKAVESYWTGAISEEQLQEVGRKLRLAALQFQQAAGLDHIPSNDFSFYDHVLDTIAMVGAVPKRFLWSGGEVDLATYFFMARGAVRSANNNGSNRASARPMEMTKWFNTNYHFIVPELDDIRRFKLASTKCLDAFVEAKAAGIQTRPVLLGPVTFLYLAKHHQHAQDDRLLRELVEVYSQALSSLVDAGADWVQIDEPCLSLDLDERLGSDFDVAYERLANSGLSILIASYFAPLKENLNIAMRLPVEGIHLDLSTSKDDLPAALNGLPSHMKLSAGVIDGRNIWRCNLKKTADLLESIAEKIGPERLIVAPSCSLRHVPVDADLERTMDEDVKSWLAFAKQKIQEISLLTDALCLGRREVEHIFAHNATVVRNKEQRIKLNNPSVRSRVQSISESMCRRLSPYEERKHAQQKLFNLPLLPTTTIGSFPQTQSIRDARKDLRAGRISQSDYESAMRSEIANNISLQEKIGLDVLVHGEPERTDMVEFFAERLHGFVITEHGWVQSYGSRCVKPPIIFGEIFRPKPMTVEWAVFAQKQTDKFVKGMLTGPVTMLNWSFVRDDRPREETCLQLALAIGDEVADLEAATIKIIQIDEPAIREGLPLRKADQQSYLDWAVKCFRLASSRVADDTQIHTHMCYSEFGDMVQAIADMDADVISIEAARSGMDLLEILQHVRYPNEIGPGVYDIHSPRVPSEEETESLLKEALKVIPPERLWVNPDCGLKTRAWTEVIPALNVLVQAAIRLRQSS